MLSVRASLHMLTLSTKLTCPPPPFPSLRLAGDGSCVYNSFNGQYVESELQVGKQPVHGRLQQEAGAVEAREEGPGETVQVQAVDLKGD